MTSRRQERFSSLIQRELGLIFLRETKSLFGDAIISVTSVVVSPDLGYVKAYLNFVNVADSQAMIEKVQKYSGRIKYILGNNIRKSVRKIPELTFFYDDTLDYIDKLDDVFARIKKDEDGKEAENNENTSI